MQCPVCNEPLIVLEHDEVEVDYCVDCGGVWLDAGEIELLLGDSTTPFAGRPAGATGEKTRKCPACDKKMLKETVEGDAPVTYDRCPFGDGLWFDQGELAEVVRGRGTLGDRAGKVSGFFGGVFADAATGKSDKE